jgi:hypothetical protein
MATSNQKSLSTEALKASSTVTTGHSRKSSSKLSQSSKAKSISIMDEGCPIFEPGIAFACPQKVKKQAAPSSKFAQPLEYRPSSRNSNYSACSPPTNINGKFSIATSPCDSGVGSVESSPNPDNSGVKHINTPTSTQASPFAEPDPVPRDIPFEVRQPKKTSNQFNQATTMQKQQQPPRDPRKRNNNANNSEKQQQKSRNIKSQPSSKTTLNTSEVMLTQSSPFRSPTPVLKCWKAHTTSFS